jgi:hypothetical protein
MGEPLEPAENDTFAKGRQCFRATAEKKLLAFTKMGDDMGNFRNLAQRPAKPAQGRGRIQAAARRALRAHGGKATTAEVLQWAYVRKLAMHKRRIESSDYRHVRRALDQIAKRVERGGGRGRPILWRANAE